MIVHLIDGTYELFRHFYGLRRFNKGEDRPFGAVVGVLHTVLKMLEEGATHVGVATDHVIESFRNSLWPGYKTSEGVEPATLPTATPESMATDLSAPRASSTSTARSKTFLTPYWVSGTAWPCSSKTLRLSGRMRGSSR